MIRYRPVLRISWCAKRRTDHSILRQLQHIEPNQPLLPTIIRQRLKLFIGHVIGQNGSEKILMRRKINCKRSRARSPMRLLKLLREPAFIGRIGKNLQQQEEMATGDGLSIHQFMIVGHATCANGLTRLKTCRSKKFNCSAYL